MDNSLKFLNNVKHKNLSPLLACSSKSISATSHSFLWSCQIYINLSGKKREKSVTVLFVYQHICAISLEMLCKPEQCGKAIKYARLGVDPLSWLLFNNRLGEVHSNLTKCSTSLLFQVEKIKSIYDMMRQRDSQKNRQEGSDLPHLFPCQECYRVCDSSWRPEAHQSHKWTRALIMLFHWEFTD